MFWVYSWLPVGCQYLMIIFHINIANVSCDPLLWFLKASSLPRSLRKSRKASKAWQNKVKRCGCSIVGNGSWRDGQAMKLDTKCTDIHWSYRWHRHRNRIERSGRRKFNYCIWARMHIWDDMDIDMDIGWHRKDDSCQTLAGLLPVLLLVRPAVAALLARVRPGTKADQGSLRMAEDASARWGQ